jgi:hypothetical protein
MLAQNFPDLVSACVRYGMGFFAGKLLVAKYMDSKK